MILTRGEFCQFSLKSRVQLLKEFGDYVCHRTVQDDLISLYRIYDFYVALIFDLHHRKVKQAEPLPGRDWLNFYQDLPE